MTKYLKYLNNMLEWVEFNTYGTHFLRKCNYLHCNNLFSLKQHNNIRLDLQKLGKIAPINWHNWISTQANDHHNINNSFIFKRIKTFIPCNQVNVSPILIVNLLCFMTLNHGVSIFYISIFCIFQLLFNLCHHGLY